MSRELQLQADVGSVGLQSLGAISSLLATLSADNIVPMALVQMEQLGTNLPVNGKYAEDVKSLLQRCKDVRLDHFAFAIGWRKNDSASLMAESAGGQAIALLSVCLKSLFKHSDIGLILNRLCSKLCPRAANISSAPQLADVATLLAGKADTLGFGNLLAQEVSRIYDIYHALDRISAPRTLLEMLSVESMTELLEKVSQALCQENKICRISGYYAMGHVVGLLQALFPQNLVLIVEGVVVQDVEHPKIRCEIDDSGLTQLYLETCVSNSMPIELPIKSLYLTSTDIAHDTSYSFKWSTWLADYLRLIFMNHGLMCNRSIMEACCDLLVLVPASIYMKATIPYSKNKDTTHIPPTQIFALLGPLPRARICLICEQILGSTPSEHHMNLREAFAKLLKTVTDISHLLTCNCTGQACDWSEGWPGVNAQELKPKRKCQRFQLWSAIGGALNSGLWSFFIDVGPNVTISPRYDPQYSHYVTDAMREGYRRDIDADTLFRNVYKLIDGSIWDSSNSIITSSKSCTLYPTVLKTMKLPGHQLVTFTLVEGQIVHGHRYHRSLRAAEARARRKAKQTLMGPIVPSHIGVHSSGPLLTIREGYDSLELHVSIEYARNEVKLDLRQIIIGYIGMRWTSMCAHPVTKPMDPFKYAPLATSVTSPAAIRGLGIAMTRWNPTAQFLCCGNGYQAILQKECCLDCAAEILCSNTNGIIIVG